MRWLTPRTGLVIVLVAAGLLFACGLPGSFLMDDYPNLSNLELVGKGAIYALVYLTEGPTGFPGRPLSYLSFLLQSGSWPNHPEQFKLVNIALHLANAVLIYAVVARTLSLARRPDAAALAAIASALWVIHPLQISTVLYIVQRMTQLATLVCLCGILAYLKGRSLAAAGEVRRGYVWMTVAVVVATPLGILAKENGILLPVFIAVIEFTLLSHRERPARWNRWAAVFLALPPLALVAYLALWPGWLQAYAVRDFTLAQRLYTEPGILWNYVGKIALPRPRMLGLYFDDYPVAEAYSSYTILAIAGWLLVLAGALLWRKRVPFLSFAVLWFLAGHVLESTALPLELYFEHRNYLPLLGPVVAVAWAARLLWEEASSRQMRRIHATLGVAFAAALAGVTWVEARNWSDGLLQVAVWAAERPASVRAQHGLGMQYLFAGKYAEANEVFERAQAIAPHEGGLGLARLIVGCMDPNLKVPDAREVAADLAEGPVQPAVVNLMNDLVHALERNACPRLKPQQVLALTDALLSNPRATGVYRWAAFYAQGRVYAVQGYLDPAMRALEKADTVMPNIDVLRDEVTWLSSAGLYDDALQFIDQRRHDPRWHAGQRLVYATFFDTWERQVREAAGTHSLADRRGK
jgi:tetratricopeptide (TPR) repeat protein